ASRPAPSVGGRRPSRCARPPERWTAGRNRLDRRPEITAGRACPRHPGRMDLGVFIPIGNNGWLISNASPQYMPTYDLNREVVQRAERLGFEFALSMIKLRGFGGR